MSDLLRLRDHNLPCEHGEYDGHDVTIFSGWCAGGREVVLRRVANFTLKPHDNVKVIEFTEPTVYVVVDEVEA